MTKLPLFCFLFLPVVLTAQETKPAQQEAGSTTIFQYLQQDTVLELHFTTDLKALNHFETKPEGHPALLNLTRPGASVETWEVKLEQRGKLRHQICEHKPLWVKFHKKDLEGHQLDSLRSLKLVVGCHGGTAADVLVLKEYLAYRLYNLLTDQSHQVQLVHAVFSDSLRQDEHYDTYGFLLEPDREMARRNRAGIIDRTGIIADQIDERDYLLMSVFEYMIGNTDWMLAANHNVHILKIPGRPLYSVTGYDFDFSGMVAAYYGAPDHNLPIKTVMERLFIGSYKSPQVLQDVLDVFNSKSALMEELVLNFNYLHESERKQVWNYLETFFKDIQRPKAIPTIFQRAVNYQEVMEVHKVKQGN